MEFLTQFPLSLLVIDPAYDGDGGLILKRETQVLSGGPPGWMIFFTDEDLAERYAKQAGVAAEIVLIETPVAAAEVARRMKAFHSCTTVALDVSVSLTRVQVPAIPIDDFISACESADWPST